MPSVRASRQERIAITGIGAVTPLGSNVQDTWNGWLQGKSGIVKLHQPWSLDLPSRIGGLSNFDITAVMPAHLARRLDRSSQIAVFAAMEAWKDAGEPEVPSDRRAVIVGCGMGGLTTLSEQFEAVSKIGSAHVNPLTVTMIMPNAAAAQVGLAIKATAGVHAPVAACATGAEAIAWGLDILRLGRADVVLVGGSEAILNRFGIAAFAAMRALSTNNDKPEAASRPFDQDRDGFVLSEGAGMLVLEREADAAQRGAEPHGYLLSAGITSDAHHIAAPDPSGFQAEQAMRLALTAGWLESSRVGLVNAHATGTELGDKAEARALDRLFGHQSMQPRVTAPKSSFGHMIGAAGAVESILTILCLKSGIIPATLNCEHPATDLTLPLITDGNYKLEESRLFGLNNSFGFGGHNVALLFQGAS
jgi:3-oxoacyl-[acyl-carrier-protein] synthase II